MSAPVVERPAALSRHARGCALLAALVLLLSTLSCGLLSLWQGVAEAIEPYWTLQLYGLLTRSKAGIEVAIGPGSILTLERDPRPHIGKIAALQKGLVLVVDGEPLIEEGYGFGLPLVYDGELVHNSRHAEIAAVDAQKKTATTSAGEKIVYDKLIFATGSQPVVPKWLKGTELKNVFTILKNKEYLDGLQNNAHL